jgi:lipid-A-disaccharide synthase
MAKEEPKKILIVAGDVSGDVHAAALVKEIKKLAPGAVIAAVGGQRLAKASDIFIYDLVSENAHGFTAPLKKLPLFAKLLSKISNYMDLQKPDFVVPVDYYGFNSLVLDAAFKRNIPAYYYIAPQVWASRKWRAKKLAKKTKAIFTIYPFEPEFHKRYGGNAIFLGNPLVGAVPAPEKNQEKHECPLIGLLPGSRTAEITGLTPVFYQTFLKIKETFPEAKAVLFAVAEKDDVFYKKLLGAGQDEVSIIRETDYAERRKADFLLTCSGTATLENALLGVPMLVAYKLGAVTYKIIKLIIQVPFVALPNILTGKEIVKEFIQDKVDAGKMAEEAVRVLKNPGAAREMKKEFAAIRKSLGQKGMAKKAAAIMLGLTPEEENG